MCIHTKWSWTKEVVAQLHQFFCGMLRHSKPEIHAHEPYTFFSVCIICWSQSLRVFLNQKQWIKHYIARHGPSHSKWEKDKKVSDASCDWIIADFKWISRTFSVHFISPAFDCLYSALDACLCIRSKWNFIGFWFFCLEFGLRFFLLRVFSFFPSVRRSDFYYT